ncbi:MULTISPECIES: hypothetical protein [unclassified Bosea (in: a-proteobacteria)]|uniref:hypothetical protein n=1 Tax=unclassified Bosea (in: a-proteobacteria) TaxID=2653178 RepID=UPI000F763CF9|nr:MULTISPECIES: hypothetical protein [unclassified Bosea (in: a-proteobacteria)]AZO77278.1 hypothetical protein BLM15_06380 [Bosea sp. Tri-49]RXT22133.1 hypothetical protein B5U98_17035 [Bosea sp. Tri-39]RXT32475.1 hypothetical protein B5U99_27880 [Bosea sp. Tri-54]
MISMVDVFQKSRRVQRARLAGLMLALGAGWAVAGLMSTPAAALDTNWKGVCTFPMAPQAYNEMMRERVCLDQNYCQQMANAQGSAYTGNGCIMVAPSFSAEQRPQGRSAYTRR